MKDEGMLVVSVRAFKVRVLVSSRVFSSLLLSQVTQRSSNTNLEEIVLLLNSGAAEDGAMVLPLLRSLREEKYLNVTSKSLLYKLNRDKTNRDRICCSQTVTIRNGSLLTRSHFSTSKMAR